MLDLMPDRGHDHGFVQGVIYAYNVTNLSSEGKVDRIEDTPKQAL